jgi:hypothetical protein
LFSAFVSIELRTCILCTATQSKSHICTFVHEDLAVSLYCRVLFSFSVDCPTIMSY